MENVKRADYGDGDITQTADDDGALTGVGCKDNGVTIKLLDECSV